MKYKIRKAKKSDANEIIRLINQLALYENLNTPDTVSGKRLIKDAFRKNPLFNILLAERTIGREKSVVGYAFYFFTYSTFLAKPTLYLEDIFVEKEVRRNGIGKLLFDELIKTAGKHNCGRIEFTVLDWNRKALSFYRKYNAKVMNEWLFHRIVL